MKDRQQRALNILRERFDPDYEIRTATQARKELMKEVAEVVGQIKQLEVEQRGEDTWLFSKQGDYTRRVVQVKANGFEQGSEDRDGEKHGYAKLFDEKDLSYSKDRGEIICMLDYNSAYNEEKYSAVEYLAAQIVKNLGK